MADVIDLTAEAARLGIKPPSDVTLRKYGLTAEDWLALLAAQDWKCPICLRRTPSWNTDHLHVAGWKRMPPEERKRYVRGVLCPFCNHRLVHSRMGADVAQRIADYFRRFERRHAP